MDRPEIIDHLLSLGRQAAQIQMPADTLV